MSQVIETNDMSCTWHLMQAETWLPVASVCVPASKLLCGHLLQATASFNCVDLLRLQKAIMCLATS
jgi:hypothetical protein